MRKLTVLLISSLVLILASVTQVSAEALKYTIQPPDKDWSVFDETGSVFTNMTPEMTEPDWSRSTYLQLGTLVSEESELVHVYSSPENEDDLLIGFISLGHDPAVLPPGYEDLRLSFYLLDADTLVPVAAAAQEPRQPITYFHTAFTPESMTKSPGIFETFVSLPSSTLGIGPALYKMVSRNTPCELTDSGLLIPAGGRLELHLTNNTDPAPSLPIGEYILTVTIQGVGTLRTEISAGVNSGVTLNGKDFHQFITESIDSIELEEYTLHFNVSSLSQGSSIINSFPLNFLKLEISTGAFLIRSVTLQKVS